MDEIRAEVVMMLSRLLLYMEVGMRTPKKLKKH